MPRRSSDEQESDTRAGRARDAPGAPTAHAAQPAAWPGAAGAVVAEVLTLTLRATTSAAQEFADYATSLVFIVVPGY